MRLDKLLSQATAFTRSQAKMAIKKGQVTVADKVVTNPAVHIDDTHPIAYMGVLIKKPVSRYIMLHKPQGTVCANKDEQHATVFDQLFLPRLDTLHVAGRLDIDTTGLVLITDDGQWLHRITSPRYAHQKVYQVALADSLSDKQIQTLQKGVQLKDEKNRCSPAEVETLGDKLIRLTITEGKYHQVKRMLAAVGNHVEKLHREAIAGIRLDGDLAEGEWRELTQDEINRI